MSVDDTLLIGRIVLVAALYLFLLVLALLLRRELQNRSITAHERAPGDLLVIEPFDTGLDPGERIPLLAFSSIGRGDDNDVVLNDSFLSNDHARLTWNSRGWVLEDLESTNGTQVNGRPVRSAAPVREQDIIEFGRVKVKLVPG